MKDGLSELYLEAHVTIEPIFDDRLNMAKAIASRHQFKVAKLLMKKRANDTETRSKYDTFMTGHGHYLPNLERRVSDLVQDLKNAGFKVWRYKIEDTVMDSRRADVLNLLRS